MNVAREETADLVPLVAEPIQVQVALRTVLVEIRDVTVAVYLRRNMRSVFYATVP